MKKIALFGLFLALFMTACQVHTTHKSITFHYSGNPDRDVVRMKPDHDFLAGTWSGRRLHERHGQVIVFEAQRDQIQLRENVSTYPSPRLKFYSMTEGEAVHFELFGETGSIQFTGRRENKNFTGMFRVSIQETNRKAWEEVLGAPLDNAKILQLILNDLHVGEFVEFQELEPRITLEEVQRLVVFRISPADFASYRTANTALKVDEVIRLRSFGVAPDQYAAYRKARPQMGIDELIRVRGFGIDAPTLAAWTKQGHSVDEMIRLRGFGVTPDWVQAMRDTGTQWTVEEMIRLRSFGITPDYLKGVKKAGYDFTVDELVRLKSMGVTVEYLQALHVEGRKNLSAATIIDMRSRGLSAERIRELRQ